MDSMGDRASNSSDGSFDLVGGVGADTAGGLQYVSTGRSKKKDKKSKKKERRATHTGGSSYISRSKSRDSDHSSPNLNASSTDWGTKYVKKQPVEDVEKISLVSSDNLDPNDPLAGPAPESFQDEFEDEMDDLEMDDGYNEKSNNFHSFGSKSEPQYARKGGLIMTYAIPILIFVLFLGGAVAAVLFATGVGKSKNNTQTLMMVPSAPENLAVVCTNQNGNTEVPGLCKDACMKAECCWNPSGDYQCDAQDQCPIYQVECNVWKSLLLGGKDSDQMAVPPLPAGLTTSCSRTFTAEVSQDCRDKCAAADCCWNKLTSAICTPDTVHYCLQYNDACEFLNDDTTTSTSATTTSGNFPAAPFPSAPEGLSVYCDPSEMEEISLHICEDKCNDAECCWKNGVNSCVSTYAPQACSPYTQACSILNQLNTAPDNSHDVTAATPPPATASSNDNTLPVAPSDLASTCSKDKIADNDTGGEALIQCEQECLKASCCWQPNAAKPCKTNVRCAGYSPSCDIFANLFDKPTDYNPNEQSLAPVTVSQVPAAPDSILTNCSPNVLKTSVEGGKYIVECEKQCLMGACCWKKNHPTQCTEAQECRAYEAPCGTNLVNALVALEGGGSNPAPAPTPGSNSGISEPHVHEAPSDLAQTCAPELLKTSVNGGENIVQCERECLLAACCWKPDHPTACTGAPECPAYQGPCGTNLVNALTVLEGGSSSSTGGTPSNNAPAPTPSNAVVENNVPNAPDNIASICNPDVLKLTIEDGDFIIQCEKECLEAACCWKPNHATVCPDAPECDEYLVPCGEHLMPVLEQMENNDNNNAANSNPASSPSIPSAPDDMSLRCSLANLNTNPDGRGFCEEACNKAPCCWDDDVTSCKSNAVCNEYSLCENLFAARTNNNAPKAPPDNLSTICAADAMLDLNYLEQCKLACADGDCCWMEDSDPLSCKPAVECRTYETECALMRDMLSESQGGGGRRMLRQV